MIFFEYVAWNWQASSLCFFAGGALTIAECSDRIGSASADAIVVKRSTPDEQAGTRSSASAAPQGKKNAEAKEFKNRVFDK
jgi:hypothetical protein